MPIKIAINGFGRIGQSAFKSAAKRDDIEIVAINGLSPVEMSAYLFKYDSVYGVYPGTVEARGDDKLIVDGKEYLKLSEKDPENLPWKDLEVDVALECTGVFRTKEQASKHLKAGAKRVIISAPAKGDDPVGTYVLGVNQEDMKDDELIISNASCTTNCMAPVMRVINDNFGVEKAFMTTIHSYTADQNLVDGTHKDYRRARAAALNMVPTETGAAKAVGLTIPDLEGIFDGMAVRVPTPCGSLSDMTILLKKDATAEEINEALKTAEKGYLKGILECTEDPIVSHDIIGNPASSIVDLSLTKVTGGNLAKIISWYDNEWGYSVRLVDQAVEIAKQIK
ncbi:type I glyceraldehyde-3-phosphate dehydrogenase [Patescibacteria group bacterium]|nr:type I glyceraldehyde-3-phosphate dehydrogenase [Patescibacteria group bacterium]MBU1673939.1 type I glyceraldehyde-3-phosphate dehydrogenase [Patescibacteria group bacterium]MBU1963933.1 type I glyceraldehyde-3-phosphate dehydrogenase [Patescibacteria group bacterium]